MIERAETHEPKQGNLITRLTERVKEGFAMVDSTFPNRPVDQYEAISSLAHLCTDTYGLAKKGKIAELTGYALKYLVNSGALASHYLQLEAELLCTPTMKPLPLHPLAALVKENTPSLRDIWEMATLYNPLASKENIREFGRIKSQSPQITE